MTKLALLFAGALLLVAAGAPQKLSPDAFRDRYAAMVAATTGRAATIVNDRTFKTTAADGTELTVNTDSAYATYLADPAQLDAILSRYTRALAEANKEPSEPIDQLVVIVRPSDYLVRSLPPGASMDSFVPSRPMAGDLSYFLAVDSAERIRTAAKSDLRRWHIDEAAAWARALANLKTRIGPLEIARLGGEEGASGLGAASGLAPSILADPKFCGPDAPAGIGGQVVLVYAKDFLLFAIPTDGEMTKIFWNVAKSEIQAGRSLSSTPLTCRDGHWAAIPIP